MAASSTPIRASRAMGGLTFSGTDQFSGRHSGARAKRASPESITTIGIMDSGPAPSGASRNDDFLLVNPHVSIFTYSKSPGLLSIPTLGGEIQEANSPTSVTGIISEAMKSPSSVDGSHSPFRLFQVASSISTPSGVA